MSSENVVIGRDLARLPVADWSACLPALPPDDHAHEPATGARLGVLAPVPLHAAPGTPPVAELPAVISPEVRTWLPVIGGQPGWVHVLVPCAPDGRTGWVELGPDVLVVAHLVHLVVDIGERTVTLHHGRSAQSWHCEFGERWPFRATVGWPCGVGNATHPTPRGRTFVLGDVHPRTGVVDHALLLAAHMPTHLGHGAGVEAVGVHTWPSASWGSAGTDGSLVVPPEAMPVLTEVARPGTAVLIH
ncbi:L,D-transpeptidase [Actinokineospora iranica]|uniref:Uncharacterized protein n=1 Tax=Actinokineospora iranica TaxID=1271860 RepID=A0A1G6VUX5_9PSEU|nr:L,D-transpeptidase [Actinokineospora iranica]SDD56636.1 hypothetical protein SAMN05216174_11377 [Actinokineospora iranica]